MVIIIIIIITIIIITNDNSNSMGGVNSEGNTSGGLCELSSDASGFMAGGAHMNEQRRPVICY